FINAGIKAINKLASEVLDITAIVGFVDYKNDIYNAAAIIHNGTIVDIYHKMFLPNYGVFDEERYFQNGIDPLNIKINEITIGLGICEDIWYPEGPARLQALAGAEVIININASPYHMGKAKVREELLATRAIDNEVIVCYANMIGGQDELVFDGQSMILNERGELIEHGKSFEEDLIVCDLNLEGPLRQRLHDPRRRKEALKIKDDSVRVLKLYTKPEPAKIKPIPERTEAPLKPVEEVYRALKLGTSDYMEKNGFTHAVIGLSGGVDSTLVACIAADAIGAKNITGVYMPSTYSSLESRQDAEVLARNLGIEFITIPINSLFDAYQETMAASFKDTETDVTEENLQARIRGNILMALSNKFGYLVLTTGNKSEMGVGYATLYGDMAGGFAVIKDVNKLLAYKICRYINKHVETIAIPERIFTKPPSAELRPDQTDQDSLPPYESLDPILRAYIEEDRGVEEISSLGYDINLVKQIINMVDKSEYKRRQAPPGIKITERAFGKDRRMPITNGYEDK
ncbi:MAG: NAD+ synthase, partial [Thermodesulfobacteriota bacterium]